MSSYGHHPTPPGMTLEQAQRDAARTSYDNEQKLLNSLKVEADEDGKYRLFGIEVPKSIAPAINILSDGFIGSVSSGLADIAYKQAKSAAKSFNFSHDDAHQAGLAAEMVMRWGVLFAKPIGEFISVNTDHGQKLLKLRRDLKADCDATGADYGHNKIINAALRDESNHYTDRLMLILPGMLSLVSQVPGAYMSQKDAWAKRDAEHSGTGMSAAIDDVMKKQMAHTTDEFNIRMQEEKQREEFYKTFKKNHGRDVKEMLKSKYGSNTDRRTGTRTVNTDFQDNPERYLRQYFEDNVWSDIKKNLAEQRRAQKNGKNLPAQSDAKPELGGLLNNQMTFAIALSTMGQGIRSSMMEDQKKKGKKPTSYALIYKLKEHMQGQLPQSEVHKEIMEIFQQVEEEIGGPNKRFSKGLLETLRDTTAPIAEYIAEGKIDPLALLRLAGEDMVIDRKHGTRQFHDVDAVRKSLEEMCCSQVIKEHEMSQQEFLGRFAVDQEHVKEAIKNTYSEMEAGQAKDLFAAVLPLEILEKVLGMDKDEIRELRKRAHEHVYREVAASVILIAQEDEKLLKKHGVSSKEIQTIKQLSEMILSDNMDAVKELVDSKDSIVTVVAAEGIHDALEGKKTVWAERVEKGKNLEALIEEAKHKKAHKRHAHEEVAEGDEHAHAHAHTRRHAPEHEDPREEMEAPRHKNIRKHSEEEHHPRSHREHAKRSHDGSHLGQGA